MLSALHVAPLLVGKHPHRPACEHALLELVAHTAANNTGDSSSQRQQADHPRVGRLDHAFVCVQAYNN
jgi:hypothetical protein